MGDQIYKCPLCDSLLTRDKWIKITGQWEDRQKLIDETKKEIEKYKKQEAELKKKYETELKREAKLAQIKGIEEGIKKEKSERERMAKMIAKQAKDQATAQKKIQELEKQLREGKTPQIAGFDYEKEVEKMLTETFPEDHIKPTGKKGDVMQIVVFNSNEIGSILYECKKTEKYSNEFIKEIKRHQEIARADRAVIVTHAPKQNKSKFFIEEGVIVIDPLGLLDIAFLLRSMLIDMHMMKLTKGQADQKGKEILRYMQSGEFKKHMIDNVEKARAAYNLLSKEVTGHRKDWTERLKIYSAIHHNTQNVRLAIGRIITGGATVDLEGGSFPGIENLEVLKLDSGNTNGRK